MGRYSMNLPAVSESEQAVLARSRVCVAGLGGLGGFVLEFLARLGAGNITGIDFDRFDISNLNRQILAREDNAGALKTEAARERVRLVNSAVAFTPLTEKLDESNAAELLGGHDLVIDALDGVPDRLLLAKACASLRIPIVHGALDGWRGQAAVVYPGDGLLDRLYSAAGAKITKPAALSFTAAAVASLQASLAARVLLGRDLPEAGTLFLLNLEKPALERMKI